MGEEGRWARRRVKGDIVMIGEYGVGESREARGKEKMMRVCEVGGECGDGMVRRGIWCGV